MARYLELSTDAIFGLQSVGFLNDSDCVSWAIGMLSSEQQSAALQMLAGLTSPYNSFEVSDLFDRAIRDLKLHPPEKDLGIRCYVTEVTQAYLIGKIPSADIIRELSQICIKLDYPKYLMMWYDLDDALSDIEANEYPVTLPEAYNNDFDAIVKKKAEEFMTQMEEAVNHAREHRRAREVNE